MMYIINTGLILTMSIKNTLAFLRLSFPDTKQADLPDFAQFWLRVLDNKGIVRVLMIWEKLLDRKSGEWRLPSGSIGSKHPWHAAIYGLFEETRVEFNPEYWDRDNEVKFTRGRRRTYIGNYHDPCVWSCKKLNTDDIRFAFVREDALIESLQNSSALTCDRITSPLEPHMIEHLNLPNFTPGMVL